MSEIELKPCPFCGGKAVFFVKSHTTSEMKSYWRIGVYCTKCNLTSPKLYGLTLALGTNAEIKTIEDERQRALDDWNWRKDEDVVRCKDCIYREQADIDYGDCYYCALTKCYVGEKDYCSRGERSDQ